jgi:thymidine kinase
MGSSKSAQALMVKFNYEQKGMKVLLIKPQIDTRGDTDTPKVRSRIGLTAECAILPPDGSVMELYNHAKDNGGCDVVIIDEVNFCTVAQINECKEISRTIPVMCYGLLVNFRCQLFDASKRLIELAESISEIKSVCKCGRKATVNARFINGKVVDEGPTVFIGGDEAYENMCYWCWQDELKKAKGGE